MSNLNEAQLKSRRLEAIARVGEQGTFPIDEIRIGDWTKLPQDWPTIPHIVRGPEHICGPARIALAFEDPKGTVYFPVPLLFADLMASAYSKGFRTAQKNIRVTLGYKG